MPDLLSSRPLLIWKHLRPTIPVAIRAARIMQRRLKPGILAASVIGNEIDDDVDSALVRFGHQIPKIIVSAIPRIDVVIVDHIVPVIAHRLVDRHQPDAVGAETGRGVRVAIVDVIEMRDEPFEITDSIAVGVSKGAHEHFVANSIAPPEIQFGWLGSVAGRQPQLRTSNAYKPQQLPVARAGPPRDRDFDG